MSEEDKTSLSSTSHMFFVYSSNLKFDRLNINTKFASSFAYRIVILAVKLGSKSLSFYNSDILYEGAFLGSSYYMSLDYENVNIDMHLAQGGVLIRPPCIEGEAPKTFVRLETVKFYYSIGKYKNLIISK